MAENLGVGMMVISIAEYNELIRKAERNDIIKRLYESGEYVSTKDIATVLGIKENKVNKEV